MAVSDTPWGNFSQADYTVEQWKAACLIDSGQGDPNSKERYKLPVREPDGTLNRNALAAAAGRLNQVKGMSPEDMRIVAKKLISLYKEAEAEPPEALIMMAKTGRSYEHWLTERRRLKALLIEIDPDRDVEAWEGGAL